MLQADVSFIFASEQRKGSYTEIVHEKGAQEMKEVEIFALSKSQ